MARRMRSYRANKGKEFEVWLNNMSVQGTKNRKARAKAKAQEERALAREEKARAKKAALAAEKQRKQAEREAAKRLREAQKQEEKYNKMYSRLALEFKQSNLVLTDTIAYRIITEAKEASVTVAQLSKYFIAGKEDELWFEAISEMFDLISHFQHNYPNIDLRHYVEGGDFYEEYYEVLEHLCNSRKELGYSTLADCEKDPNWQQFNEKLNDRENFLDGRRKENKKIDEFLLKLCLECTMLPEDLKVLSDKIDADDGMSLTVSELESSAEYQAAVSMKKSFAAEVNRQYELLKNSVSAD